MSKTAASFRKITPDFLWKAGIPVFKIYIKVADDMEMGEEEGRFVHDVSYSSATHQEILDMMASNEDTDFFIHENTLVQYYGDRVKKLRENLGHMGTGQDRLKSVYNLASEIMLEYFEKIGSSKILRVQDDLVDVLDQCLAENKLTLMDAFRVASKEDNPHTHCVNVGLYCMALGMGLQMAAPTRRDLFLGGVFSDIGKKIIPDGIKLKKEKLTPEEFKEIRKHPAAARKILNDMRCYSEGVLRMTGEHHEKFNGQGYPRGLSGESIALQARVCSLMDVFSALTSDRSHRSRLNPMDVFSIMKGEMAGSFDDRIFANFVKMLAPAAPRQKTQK